MVKKAIEFATKAHEGQFRKGTTRPYIVHPLEVCEIVATLTDDQEVIAAAVLHDTVEDCDGVTEEVIEREFNARIAQLVAQESEDKSKTWEERKGATIERLKTASMDVKMIALGDKLSNIRGINKDYQEVGEEVWNRFSRKDKNKIGWYYKGLRDSFQSTFEGEPAFMEYRSLVEKVFGE